MRNYTVPVAKRVGADLLQIVVPENAEVFSGRRKSGQMQKVWEDTHWENSWVVLAEKSQQAE